MRFRNRFAKVPKKVLIALAAILLFACGIFLFGQFMESEKELSALEKGAFDRILGEAYNTKEPQLVTAEVMTKERQQRYDMIDRVYVTDDQVYCFLANSQGYGGPIRLAVAIDGKTEQTIGVEILAHEETPEYVRDFESSWFTDRFAEKSILSTLKLAKLEATDESEVIAITGATVTTQAVIDGVNACMGACEEYLFQQTAKELAEKGALRFLSPSGELAEVTSETIHSLPVIKRTMTIQSTEGTTSHQFRGTNLSGVIAQVDPTLLSQYLSVEVMGADGYSSIIETSEIQKENAVFLMYEDNGEPIKNLLDEPGGYRLIIVEDAFGQRFTHDVVEFRFREEK